MSDQDRVLRVVKGAVGAPGVAVGLAYAVDRGRLTVPMRLAGPDSAAGESARMRLAVEESRGQLTAALGREIADEHKQIIEAYITWLQDPSLIEEAERLIAEEGINAEWAVKKLFDGLKSSVDPQDERARSERVHLFDEIGHRILRNLMGVHQESLETIPAGVILVAHNISPGDMALVDRHRIAGLAMDIGGSTSHTSILARGMGIPTVVGLDHVTSVIQTGDLVILDATLGLVVVNPDLEQVDKYQAKARRLREARQALLEFRDLPSRTQDGVDIRIMANIELPDEIPLMFEHGLRDVGLFRSEFIFLARGVPATEEEQFEIYARMLRDVGPDHVLTVRTLDLGMEKVFADVRAPTEANPAMGLRAIRFCLQSEDLFKDQLRALMRASVYGRLRIMFPMISGLTELRRAKLLLDEVCQELDLEDHEYSDDVAVGIMIEVPSAALMADRLAREVDFFSIGTNDLIQYTLAVDRGNEAVSYLYTQWHPAVLRLVQGTVEAGRRAGVEVSMCGEMAGDIEMTLLLLGLGVSDFSVSPGSALQLKRLVGKISSAEAKSFAARVMELGTDDEVRRALRNELMRRFPELFAEFPSTT